jgi:hypothetical protein
MKLYIIIWKQNINTTLVIESTAMGYCLFSRWLDRAKLFSETEADELLAFLKQKKYNERNNFFKIEYEKRD